MEGEFYHLLVFPMCVCVSMVTGKCQSNADMFMQVSHDRVAFVTSVFGVLWQVSGMHHCEGFVRGFSLCSLVIK